MKKAKRQYYTNDERIIRAWAIEEIKDLMSRRAMYNASDMRREELNDLWVRTKEYWKTASFGRNWGYYVGMDEISHYYVVNHDQQRQKELDALRAAHPEIQNIRDNLGYGSAVMHPMTTPMVILSGDGRTAQGTWWSLGYECVNQPEGDPVCLWYAERTAADFVQEDGQWKIWHLFVTSDYEFEAGTSISTLPTFQEPGTCIPENEFGEPTIKMLAHDRSYGWIDGYPHLPSPYQYFTNDIGFGPEGHPELKED